MIGVIELRLRSNAAMVGADTLSVPAQPPAFSGRRLI
jgi:hypothetical protein